LFAVDGLDETERGYQGRCLDDEASLSTQEDASKQGRKILDIDADEDITLDSTHVDTDPDMFGVHDLHGDEVFIKIKEPVVNAATTTTTTATTTVADEVEMTLAQTLIEIKSAKPKAKRIVMQEPSESTLTSSSQKPSQVKSQGSKDKGKEKMIEPEKPLKKKDQDKVETDYELAQRLQQEEQEELTIEEKSKLFQQLLEKRRKFFSAKRAEEKRNRPPTKAELFDKAMKGKRVQNRIELFDFRLEQEKAKKQKIDDDQEEAKLKELMEVISDEEGIAIDAIPLSTKPPSIVDYKIIKEGKINIYQIIRADGSSKRYSAVIHMLKDFDRRFGNSRRIVGIKRLHDDLRVTAAQLVLLVQSYNCLFRVNAAGTKLQLLKGYNCSRIKTAEKNKD
ncbi:hypothetical protein Tco_1413025, partial [Tanacetum coccineum]